MQNFTAITELPHSLLHEEQWTRMIQRYHLGTQLAQGKDVLEVACGAGIGLGLLHQQARSVVGCDYTGQVLALAKRQYGGRVPLVCSDAHHLPFAGQCFDLILTFEAIYYLQQIDWFLAEARRLLRPTGVLFLCTSNPTWPHFVAGQMSVHYPDLPELAAKLTTAGFTHQQFYGALPLSTTIQPHKTLFTTLRKVALRYKTFTSHSPLTRRLKQLIYGRLRPLPAELSVTHLPGDTVAADLTPLVPTMPDQRHRVLFAVATHEAVQTG